MQLEELRMNKKMGDDDPDSDRRNRQSRSCRSKPSTKRLLQELQSYWKEWDSLIDRSQATAPTSDAQVTRQDGGRTKPPQLHPQSGAGCE